MSIFESIEKSNIGNTEQPILHIEIGKLQQLYNSLKPTIEKNGDYYLSYMKSDTELEKKYNVILNTIIDIDRKVKDTTHLGGGNNETNEKQSDFTKSVSETLSKPATKIVAGIGLGALAYVIAIMIYNYLWKVTIARKKKRVKQIAEKKVEQELTKSISPELVTSGKAVLKKLPILPK